MSLPSPEEMMRRARAFVVFEEGETPAGPGVYLSSRGPDSWAVLRGGHGGSVLSRDGFWEYEPLSSGRSDDFLEQHRFTLEEAWEFAMRYGAELPKDYAKRVSAFHSEAADQESKG